MGYFDGLNLQLLVEPPAPPEKSGLIRRAVGDTAVTAVKGSMLLPEMAVGLASLATGGRAGKAAEEAGFRPKQAREFLDTLYSPEQQAANREVQQAEGFLGTLDAVRRNPSTLIHAVVESAPSMLGAAGIARAGMGLAVKPGLSAAAAAGDAAAIKALQARQLIAVGAGEGIFSAGSAAEQIRQQTDDGLLTGEQSLIAGTSGALTGAIGSVAGKIANKLGIGDVQQMLAGVQQAGPKAEKALTRALLEGFATEGVLQELPQSAQEQIAQNVALGKPWDEGVGNAAAMGALAGGVMGVGGAGLGRLRREPTPVDPLAEGNARADAAMERLATTNDVGQMIEAAREIATATPLQPLAITTEQEARVMQAGEELAQADLTDIKNMGRLDRTRSPEPPAPPAPIIPASEEGPAPFLDRLLTATEALQDPTVRQRVQQAAGPQYLAQLDQYAETANTPGLMDGVGDDVRERFLGLLERAVFPERFRQPAPQVSMPERRKSDPVPIEPFNVKPVTDPVLDYVESKRAENTMAARAFVKEFEAGRITRRDVVRVMQDRNADPLGSNPNPLADLQPAEPAPNLIQQRLEAAARAGQAKPAGIQIEPSRARPKEVSDERNPERAVPGAGGAADAGSQPRAATVVQGELQQPGAPAAAGAPVPSAVPGVDAERTGRGLGDDALSKGNAADQAGYAEAAAQFNALVPQLRQARAEGNQAEVERITAEMRPLDLEMRKRQSAVQKRAAAAAESERVANETAAKEAMPIGSRLRPSEHAPEKGLYWEKTGPDEWTGRGNWFQKGKTRTNAEQAKAGGLVAQPAPTDSAQAQAGTPAEGAGGSRPTPGQANQQDRLRDARAIGRQASEEGKPRSPPHAFTALEKQVWRAGWDEAKATKGAVPQVPTNPTDQAAILPLDQAANEAATSPQNDLPEPTEAQKEAGNYKVGRIKVASFDISVENPAGSERSGIDPDGKKWRNTLAHHYGYIRRSEGADGDHVDVFVNPGTPEDYDGMVFVVDQADPKTGRWDEHKVMMGFPSAKAAQEAYQANYAKDWTGLRAVQPMTMEQFKAWVSDPANTKKPAAKGVKPGKGEKVERPDELVELRKREAALKSLRECLG